MGHPAPAGPDTAVPPAPQGRRWDPVGAIRHNRRLQLALVLGPPALWVLLCLVLPYTLVLITSFWAVENMQTVVQWNTGNYARFFRSTAYYGPLLRSIRVAAMVMACALIISYPMAYTLAFKVRRHKMLLYTLVVIPLWVSYLVRVYAWKTILGTQGILNGVLQYFGIIDEPVAAFLYSPFAVIITLTHIFTPFTLMPLFAVMQQIPRALLEAAGDLYANRWRTFWHVIFPLTLPGVIAGGTMSFVLSLGDFIAPILVGGPKSIMISNVVVNLFGSAFNWPLGSAVSIILLLVVLSLLSITYRLEHRAGGHIALGHGRGR